MKSTFQKSDATYPHGSLREQPEMKKPVGGMEYVYRLEQYEKYLETLRIIPCSENNWKDGQELEEGKDYEVVPYLEKVFETVDQEIAETKLAETGKLIAVPILEEDIYDAVRDYRKSHPIVAQETEYKKGLTYKEIQEALKVVPDAPAFSDLSFVENSLLPDNTVLVSRKVMKILKQIFHTKTPKKDPLLEFGRLYRLKWRRWRQRMSKVHQTFHWAKMQCHYSKYPTD